MYDVSERLHFEENASDHSAKRRSRSASLRSADRCRGHRAELSIHQRAADMRGGPGNGCHACAGPQISISSAVWHNSAAILADRSRDGVYREPTVSLSRVLGNADTPAQCVWTQHRKSGLLSTKLQ